MDKCKSKFKQYFKYVDTFVVRWNSFLASSLKPLSVISNLTEQVQIIHRADLPEEMFNLFPDLKYKLESKLYALLEEELCTLQKLQSDMNLSNTELRNRLTQLDQTYKQSFNCELKEAEESTKENSESLCPPHYELLEMASDIWMYYHDLWLNINGALLCLDYEELRTVDNLRNAFKEDVNQKQQISRILALTKHLISEV